MKGSSRETVVEKDNVWEKSPKNKLDTGQSETYNRELCLPHDDRFFQWQFRSIPNQIRHRNTVLPHSL